MRDSNESSAGELITRLIQNMGARDENGVVPFVIAWPKIVGTDLAAHTRVLDIRNGAVLVGVDHPGWLQRLHLEQNRVLAAIQRQFPSLEARYLHFTVIAPGEAGAPPAKAERSPAEAASPPAPTHGSASLSSAESAAARSTNERSTEEQPTDEQPAEPATSTSTAAAEDEEFQQHLRGLEKALRGKKQRR